MAGFEIKTDTPAADLLGLFVQAVLLMQQRSDLKPRMVISPWGYHGRLLGCNPLLDVSGRLGNTSSAVDYQAFDYTVS